NPQQHNQDDDGPVHPPFKTFDHLDVTRFLDDCMSKEQFISWDHVEARGQRKPIWPPDDRP
ncbi:hypothetical protein MK280_05295, partial [Myxococcota bacterium]|nr:hypothetical protein [Myxococcota bacterium]